MMILLYGRKRKKDVQVCKISFCSCNFAYKHQIWIFIFKSNFFHFQKFQPIPLRKIDKARFITLPDIQISFFIMIIKVCQIPLFDFQNKQKHTFIRRNLDWWDDHKLLIIFLSAFIEIDNFFDTIIKINNRMEVKMIILLIALSILSFSSYILFNLLDEHGFELRPQSFLRFKVLLAIHIFIGLAFLVLIKIRQFYHEMLCTFIIFLVTFLTIFTCELIVHSNFHRPNGWDDSDNLILGNKIKKLLPLQVTYTDIYYLIYMYAIMGISLTGIFIVISELLACLRSTPLPNKHEDIFENLQYSPCMEGEDCAICLGEYLRQSKFIRIIKCGHIFHDDCIREWTMYNHICPLDRNVLSQ